MSDDFWCLWELPATGLTVIVDDRTVVFRRAARLIATYDSHSKALAALVNTQTPPGMVLVILPKGWTPKWGSPQKDE